MKKTLFYVCLLCCSALLNSCGDDDNDFQTIRQNKELHMKETMTLPAGAYTSASSSNTFVATVSQGGIITPQHVGTAVINAVNPDRPLAAHCIPSRQTPAKLVPPPASSVSPNIRRRMPETRRATDGTTRQRPLCPRVSTFF